MMATLFTVCREMNAMLWHEMVNGVDYEWNELESGEKRREEERGYIYNGNEMTYNPGEALF